MHRRLNARDAFPKSTDEYAQQVAQLLQHRRAELNAAWEELEEGWTANNERMAESGLSPRNSDEGGVVKLNVGGSNVGVCWHLFAEVEGFEDSVLGAFLEGVWGEGRVPRDTDGRIVLDESPSCIKHITHAMLRATSNGRSSSSVTEGLQESAASSASWLLAADETPCLVYTAHVMGLPGCVPTNPTYVKMNGGSTIMEPFEIAPFSATIREWVGGSTDTITLIYRATRDGFDSEAFEARCNEDSPHTISLVRVSPDPGSEDGDSVVGGYAVYPWSGTVGRELLITREMFVFMLKDGCAARKNLFTPIKMDQNPLYLERVLATPQPGGLCFGGGDLATIFDQKSGGCTLQASHNPFYFQIGLSTPFLALDEKRVVDIEVYQYSTTAPPATTTPIISKPGGDVLTDAEAHDIHSFGNSIARSLMGERVVLDRAAKEMEAAGERVSAAVDALETVYGPSVAAGEQETVVELNVRGVRMTTLRSTLQACPRSALATMFEDRWPATDKDKDEHGRRLIDCDPTCFSKILDVLRMRKRASWSRGVTPEKQEGSLGKCPGAIAVKKADLKTFRAAVQMYFPGCESFIMGLSSVHTTPSAG